MSLRERCAIPFSSRWFPRVALAAISLLVLTGMSASDAFAFGGVDDTVGTSNADTDGDQEEATSHEHHFVDHDYSFYTGNVVQQCSVCGIARTVYPA